MVGTFLHVQVSAWTRLFDLRQHVAALFQHALADPATFCMQRLGWVVVSVFCLLVRRPVLDFRRIVSAVATELVLAGDVVETLPSDECRFVHALFQLARSVCVVLIVLAVDTAVRAKWWQSSLNVSSHLSNKGFMILVLVRQLRQSHLIARV